jgi:tetratricopeptide (TPR) repeat protein
MDFRKFPILLAVILLAVLVVQPVLSASNLTALLSASNVVNVTNHTSDLEKDIATSYYNNAEHLLVDGHYADAIAAYDMALASNTTMIYKSDALLYLYRDKAFAQIQLENYTGAIATLDAGLATYPKDAMLWNNKGYAQYRLGKMQDALSSYDNSISFDRNYTTAYINKGDALSAMGRHSEAVSAYTQANETDPFNLVAYKGLEAARKGEAESGRTMNLMLVIALIAIVAGVVWYVRFRKPAKPAPEEKKPPSKKKK